MSLPVRGRSVESLAVFVAGSWIVATIVQSMRNAGRAEVDASGAERSRKRAVDLMFPEGSKTQQQPDPMDSRSPADVAVGQTDTVLADPHRYDLNGWMRVANSQDACHVLGSALAEFRSGADPDDLDAGRWKAISDACAQPLQCGVWTQRVHPTCRIGSDRGKVKGLGFNPSGTHMTLPYRQERAINDIVRNSGVVRAGRSGDVRATGLSVVPPNAVQPGTPIPGWTGSGETGRFAMRQI